jgi:hypothetical protein
MEILMIENDKRHEQLKEYEVVLAMHWVMS